MDKNLEFQFLSQPTDVNYGGKVHGGAVMKWIDQAGYACATQWSGSYCVTVYVGGIRFFKPILIGHIIKLKTKVIYTGKSSMHIAVDVYSKPVRQGEFIKNTHCIIVFVAVDEHGKPVAVPELVAENEIEESLREYAIKLMNLRKKIDEEMLPFIFKE